MASPLSLLKSRLQASEARLRTLEAEIAAATEERAALQKETEHLAFCVALLESPDGGRKEVQLPVVDVPAVPVQPKAPPKPKLQETILASVQAGETVTVGDVGSLLERSGIQAKREVVYATLFRLANLGFLTKVGPGVYKKPEQDPPPPPQQAGDDDL